MSETRASRSEVDQPQRYAILVKGHLEPRWANWFEGLTLSHASEGTTLLEGWLTDQAALHGVLNKIRDLGLPIVSVQALSLEE